MSTSPVTVRVNLPQRAYDLLIGHGLLHGLGRQVALRCPAMRAAIVTDSNVGPLYLDAAIQSLQAAGIAATQIVVPTGEASKSLNQLSELLDVLASHHHARDEPIIALGGGVVGDLAGFAAAIWLRGVPFVQCPTSLEAMIDASVGGKTGINQTAGKNLIGAFYQPRLVCIDPACLSTLSPRDYTAALAESVKHAVIADPAFLAWHEAHVQDLRAQQAETVCALIERNCRIKARYVEKDEREEAEKGVGRAALNFGHTIGHAIEAVSSYSLRHGEAVSLGMIVALDLSVRGCGLSDVNRCRVEALLAVLGLPVKCAVPLDMDELRARLGADKKVRDQRVRFVVTPKLGETDWLIEPNEADLRAAIDRLR